MPHSAYSSDTGEHEQEAHVPNTHEHYPQRGGYGRGTYRGGAHRGQHRGRGGRGTYSPYARPSRYPNRSMVFNANASSDITNAHAAASTTSPKQGNLQPAKNKDLCATFTLTGECARPGCSHVFDHDPAKLSICKTSLFKGNCPEGDHCSLSHEASEYNTPHCQHFQKGRCSKDDCQFPHVRLNPAAPNCEAFGQKGYCENGSRCTEVHAHECPTFANTGTCRFGDRCRLGHIIRASNMKKKTSRPPTDPPSPPSNNANGLERAPEDDILSDEETVQAIEDRHYFTQQNDYVPLE
ncbi:hypothetical protein EK21DRAFT_100789 [Setomelanomma holmii]|uniref:C3H1-type domain-containing protein n=1 Tax=Setomelanomma holmii TaxID=210430 RepID=A0A9P4HA94_9PLEO|nr:hypothetical protein EK21DRAFT_100789 [Setomelanomma holmii]